MGLCQEVWLIRCNTGLFIQDFLVELIAREREEALKLYASSYKPENLSNFHKDHLASPVIFLRKWMGEGFVNSLDLPAVLLIWDQLFMQNWNRNVMESFCLVLLMLLKESIMAANDFPAIRQILLSGGYHLLTADIQRAWIHIQQGGLLVDIPGMNRLRQRQVHEVPPRLQGTSVTEDFRKILPFGVKNIVLKIILTDYSDHLNAFLKDFDPIDLLLRLSVYSGDVKFFTKKSCLKPILLEQINKNESINKAESFFLLNFNELFEFEAIDPPDFSSFTKSVEKPYLLIKAFHSDGEQGVHSLGWAKIDAFEQEARSGLIVWKPREFSSLLSFHPGKEPDNINECTSSISGSGLNTSSIQFTVYDPTKDYKRSINHVDLENGKEDPSSVPAWVKHDESIVLPPPTTTQEPFNLCIDALHYIPDCATLVKVSAKILNPGEKSVSEIVVFPNIYSSARNPVFNFCQQLNTEDGKVNVNAHVLFQVTTLDPDSGNMAVIGNCMLRLFNNDGRLNVGGFQLKLRTGVPNKKLQTLAPPDLLKYPAFPCCSLLVRLLPPTQDSVPMASYTSGYYFTDYAKPTRSELKIISTFQKDVLFPKSVKDMAEHIMKKEQSQGIYAKNTDWGSLQDTGIRNPKHIKEGIQCTRQRDIPLTVTSGLQPVASKVSETPLKDWYEARLGGQKLSLEQPSLPHCKVHHAVRYGQQTGLHVRIKQAFGLQDNGLYVNVFSRVLKGVQSMQLLETPERWGGDEKLLTRQHDFTSLQRSPRWLDPSVVLHPYFDDNSVLLVQVLGMAAAYVPHSSSDQRGHVISSNGQEVELQPLLGWTVFPLFDRHYVNSGIHSAPLFQGFLNAVSLIIIICYLY
ncbi:uncharacterized protein LOC142289817 [Anomaloglossus baeobatrachus]|uniref:uncharacterized protein LOC142289817 n=1 Tax=Anomaloglossus baeobatrachus TaxID=238106 RepID=UPI003F501D3D